MKKEITRKGKGGNERNWKRRNERRTEKGWKGKKMDKMRGNKKIREGEGGR